MNQGGNVSQRPKSKDPGWKYNKWAFPNDKSNLSKEIKGKRANDIVFTPTFWNNITFSIKVMSPIVKVLRLVDNEKKPAMGYIYVAMERAKLAIKAALNQQQDEYEIISDIIDKRWNSQLHHPLYAVGYYLNLQFYCYNKEIEDDKEVAAGLHECIRRLVPEKDTQDAITIELLQWVNQAAFFGLEVAKRQHMKLRGGSSLGKIHSKKRNRLEHQKLHDLVYVKYNTTLKNCRDNPDDFDKISLDVIDDSNEWLTGIMDEDRVHSDEDITWTMVGEASGPVGQESPLE
uniref:uncharacterized protein LOC122592542 n=1 Tax=Erigeron canadensis TaxID=72917 RepID=UPI001CB8B5CA|nr:uncharacterized protein LOC122592542 [Erigeron canadensis]